MVIAAVPTAAAQTVVAAARRGLLGSRGGDRVRYLLRHAVAHVVAIATVVACLRGVHSPREIALGLQTVGPALALAPLLVLSLFVPVAYGVLQGMERFVTLGT